MSYRQTLCEVYNLRLNELMEKMKNTSPILFTIASETSNSYGMDELTNLDLKSRFTIFERASSHSQADVEIREEHKSVKRSESILSRLARLAMISYETYYM